MMAATDGRHGEQRLSFWGRLNDGEGMHPAGGKNLPSPRIPDTGEEPYEEVETVKKQIKGGGTGNAFLGCKTKVSKVGT